MDDKFVIEYPSMSAPERNQWWDAEYQQFTHNKRFCTVYETHGQAWTELERMKAFPVNNMVFDARIVKETI
jgi:hypothetical protein